MLCMCLVVCFLMFLGVVVLFVFYWWLVCVAFLLLHYLFCCVMRVVVFSGVWCLLCFDCVLMKGCCFLMFGLCVVALFVDEC